MDKITAEYQHSKIGTFMFNLCARWTIFLVKHRVLYYILACTWGIIMTLIGLLGTVVCGILKICRCNVNFKKFNWIYSISIGPDYWGGCEMGLMFFRDQKSYKSLNYHEFGHTFQNCLLGPLFPLLVALPSATHYWIQEIRSRKGLDNKPYDSLWFEDAATQCGTFANKYLNK